MLKLLLFTLVAAVAGSFEFFRCANYVRRSPRRDFDRQVKLRVYALYKQACFGDCEDNEPEHIMAQWKKEAWCKLKGMSISTARIEYVKLIDELVPDWRDL